MKILDQLLLQQVKRYPICHVNREQSVAEHSYNVLLIARYLVEDEADTDLKEEVMHYAIDHDMDEITTGDIPSPFKRHLRQECPAVIKYLDGEHFIPNEIKAIVKLADCLEAVYYVRQFGGSTYTQQTIYPDILGNYQHVLNTSGVRDSIRQRAMNLEKYLV